jgi:hypothetical protein
METTPRSRENSRSISNQLDPTPARVAVTCRIFPSSPSISHRPGSAISKDTSSKTKPSISYHCDLEVSSSRPTFLYLTRNG